MLEVLGRDYISLARAFGVKESVITRKHAFRNAQLPVVTIIGLQLTSALGGAVLTETVFNINGMGRLIIQAIRTQDYAPHHGDDAVLRVHVRRRHTADRPDLRVPRSARDLRGEQ